MQVAVHSPRVRVNLYWSDEAKGFWADSPDLDGLTVAGDTREEVMAEARLAAETLLELSGVSDKPELTFADAEYRDE